MSTRDYNQGKKIEAMYRPYLSSYYDKYYDDVSYLEKQIFYDTDIDCGVKKNGNITFIEEKFADDTDGTYTQIFVETNQNTTIQNGTGWIDTSRANELIYVWCCGAKRELRINHIDFKPFKKWFKKFIKYFPLAYAWDNDTKAEGRLVTMSHVPKKYVIRQETIKY